MTLVISVKSCLKDLVNGAHDAIRSTWGRDAKNHGIDVRFFVGSPASNATTPRFQPDETLLKCGDGYRDLPYKTREICRWFLGKKVDNILLCDTDTYIMVKYVITSGYEKYDYLGSLQWSPSEIKRYVHMDPDGKPEVQEQCYSYASGGMGYFLSREAAAEIAESTPTSWCEDLWVGQVLMPLCLQGEMRFESSRSNSYTGNQYSIHYDGRWKGNPPYDPKSGWMEQTHQQYRETK